MSIEQDKKIFYYNNNNVKEHVFGRDYLIIRQRETPQKSNWAKISKENGLNREFRFWLLLLTVLLVFDRTISFCEYKIVLFLKNDKNLKTHH